MSDNMSVSPGLTIKIAVTTNTDGLVAREYVDEQIAALVGSVEDAQAAASAAGDSAAGAAESAGIATEKAEEAVNKAASAEEAANTATTNAKTAQEAAETAAGAAAEAKETLESIPEDYKDLAQEVDKLSEEIDDEAAARNAAITTERNRAVARENEIESLFTAPTQEAVDKWLDEHPEATTTVPDASLSVEKFTAGAKKYIIKDYVTPEMFGAVGDGVTDDTAAIQLALDSGTPVVGIGHYAISKTVCVNSDAYLKDIIYNGVSSSFAFEIDQADTVIQPFTLEVRNIVSSGGGIRLVNNSDKMMRYITLKIGSIHCAHHGLSYESIGAGMQYFNVYLDGIIYVTGGNCINCVVAHNDNHSVWIGEVKIFGGLLSASNATGWGVYCDGYSKSKNKYVTAVRLIGCSLEQCVNGMYLNEVECVTLVASRTEAIQKTSLAENAKALVLNGWCDKIKIEGFSLPFDGIDLSGLSADYGSPVDISLGLISRNNVHLGCGFVGADHRLKIKPMGRITEHSKILGTSEKPATVFDYSGVFPSAIKLYGNSYLDLDSSYDFFGCHNLVIHVVSTGGVHILYRMPVTNELVEIANLRTLGYFRLENYYASLGAQPVSHWRVVQLDEVAATE